METENEKKQKVNTSSDLENKADISKDVDEHRKVFTPVRNSSEDTVETKEADSASEKSEDEAADIVKNFHDEDDDLDEIQQDLARQVCDELDDTQIADDDKNKKKRFPRWAKILAGVLSVLLCLILIFVGTPWGRHKLQDFVIYVATEYAYGKMDYDDGNDVVAQDPTEDIDNFETDDSLEVIWGNSGYDGSGRHEDYVINILLIGEEAIGSEYARGRTDMMMIASMNIEDKTLKLTSLMRDMLVQIPDYNGKSYQDNKLNVAYEIGGVELLYETIALNFDVKLDGYALVGFDDFESIIDILDGVEVTLSQSEASYLNSTNYITDIANRNVVAGTQLLNGDQALGFCRIRHVATIDDQHYDYGRTSRQRVVLNAIFDKCKEKSTTQLIFLMNELLEYVTTDITKEQFRNYLEIGMSLNIQEIENCRIPANDTYEEGSVRGMSVLIPDLDANIKVLHSFIFGDYLEDGLSDGIILDGVDHLEAQELQKEQETQETSGQ